MTPTKYELLIDRGRIVLRGYSPECERGYFDAESHPYKTGASLPTMFGLSRLILREVLISNGTQRAIKILGMDAHI
jgi:hypothetical protein